MSGQEKWFALPYKDRLEIAEFIFHQIADEPCSFRALIYGRLGFECAEYEPLYVAGGMTITNAISFQWDYNEKLYDES